jgi:hypothetical protein
MNADDPRAAAQSYFDAWRDRDFDRTQQFHCDAEVMKRTHRRGHVTPGHHRCAAGPRGAVFRGNLASTTPAGRPAKAPGLGPIPLDGCAGHAQTNTKPWARQDCHVDPAGSCSSSGYRSRHADGAARRSEEASCPSRRHC